VTIDYRTGDTRDLVADIPDGTIDLVASSPPFIALRSYLPADHPDKGREIGSEPDPATFLATLLGLTAEWFRVLTPHGSIAIELGDTYSGSGGAGGDYNPDGLREGQGKFEGSARKVGTWPRAKSLALIPQLYATSLAYGRNLLTGEPTPFGSALVRNVIVWHRPNPSVGALGDKYRPSTSYITVATLNPKRWFDLTAVRGEPSPNTHARTARGVTIVDRSGKSADRDGNWSSLPELATTAGAPPLDAWFDRDDHDLWNLTTQPSRLAHYAMWPAKLAERLILSMCPAEVCRTCGEPRRRVERSVRLGDDSHASPWDAHCKTGGPWTSGLATRPETLGWTDCGHDDYRPGRVLDPFAGTGTTLAVADLHGRDAIGIDLDPRNRDLLPARMDECRRALFGTTPELPGQMSLLGEGA
jgi:site-specific DNA-methyltransferase (adenine-specific)